MFFKKGAFAARIYWSGLILIRLYYLVDSFFYTHTIYIPKNSKNPIKYSETHSSHNFFEEIQYQSALLHTQTYAIYDYLFLLIHFYGSPLLFFFQISIKNTSNFIKIQPKPRNKFEYCIFATIQSIHVWSNLMRWSVQSIYQNAINSIKYLSFCLIISTFSAPSTVVFANDLCISFSFFPFSLNWLILF